MKHHSRYPRQLAYQITWDKRNGTPTSDLLVPLFFSMYSNRDAPHSVKAGRPMGFGTDTPWRTQQHKCQATVIRDISVDDGPRSNFSQISNNSSLNPFKYDSDGYSTVLQLAGGKSVYQLAQQVYEPEIVYGDPEAKKRAKFSGHLMRYPSFYDSMAVRSA